MGGPSIHVRVSVPAVVTGMATARRGAILPAAGLLALAAFAGLRAFVTVPVARSPALRSSNPVVSLRARGGDFTVTDAEIEQFLAETVSGSGGPPPRKGLIEEMVVKFFLGEYRELPDGKVDFKRASSYTGPGGMVGKKDAKAALDMMKEQMKIGKYISKGGPGNDETTKVRDDGHGLVWLAADMTPGGLNLALFKSVPYGKRPLLAFRVNEIDAAFDKINWAKALERVDITMGGPQIKQR